jgi:flagellar basal body-associated protein FliL
LILAIVIPIIVLIIISIGIVVFIFLRKKRTSVPPASTGIYVTSYSDPEPAQYYEIPEYKLKAQIGGTRYIINKIFVSRFI